MKRQIGRKATQRDLERKEFERELDELELELGIEDTRSRAAELGYDLERLAREQEGTHLSGMEDPRNPGFYFGPCREANVPVMLSDDVRRFCSMDTLLADVSPAARELVRRTEAKARIIRRAILELEILRELLGIKPPVKAT